jgi:phenylalanyl-tRNA synthetase beta chain
VRLFEVGNVFHAGVDGPVETLRIAGVISGPAFAEQWSEARRGVDFFDLKGDVESLCALSNASVEFGVEAAAPGWLHPGQGAALTRSGRHVGHLGALHPDLLRALDIDGDVYAFECDVEPLALRELPRAQAVSRYPSVRRDLSFELPESVAWAAVEAAIRDAVGETLAGVVLFDRYADSKLGMSVKSLAMGLILQDRYRTLTDQDADRCVALAVAALESGCKAKLRG